MSSEAMSKRIYSIIFHSLLLIALLFTFNGCSSIRTQDGVTIEKESGNPFKFW